ncbi:MAG: hypothetical protein A2252_03285 [Elusimicrobia bacterium RIFOXYA2_FULL_39_19]|nr:MAG: hypothetical protein A2252_03285 [Elusimicrobia bacterium RIFOXYA2_FULL_39_19]
MIKINLVPQEALEKAAKQRVIILVGLGIGIFVSLCIVFLFYRIGIEKSLTSELNTAQQELNKYKTVVDEVNRLKGITAQLEARKSTIENLMKGRLVYPKFMEEFMSILPPPIWLNSMNTTTSPDGFFVNISCISYDTLAIADFITNLQSVPKFGNIEISGIATAPGSKGIDTFSFTMTFSYKALQP